MTKSKFQDLKAKIAELEAQAEAARAEEASVVLAEVQEKVMAYGLTPQQVFGNKRWGAKQVRGALPPKYRDPKTGAEWSGRGRAPAWIADKKRERYLIQQPS